VIERYTLPEMAALWSDRRKLDLWKEIEALALEGWAATGRVPDGAAAAVRAAPPVDVEVWRLRDEEIHHDVAAFVDVLAGSMPDHGAWLHYGLTSSDVLDTATGALLSEAAGLMLTESRALFEVIRRRAFEHRSTVMMGRTHGVWAEPTTFGLKMAGWAFQVRRAHLGLAGAAAGAAVGTVSGAVGTYADVPPAVEAHVCSRLGLSVEEAPTQVVARDRHAAFLSAVALMGAAVERIALEVRHLARSEVAEVAEPFRAAQKGSSAMPHKRNPVLSENLSGLARLLRGYAAAAQENVALWHERDISHSSVERVALPDATTVLHFMLRRAVGLADGLVVDAGRMGVNLDAAGGLVHSQAVLLALVETGMARDDAYRIVQRHAAAARQGGPGFEEALAADPEVCLDPGRLAGCFDPERSLRHADVVFERLAAASL
jgi:adenylosuccinate lyase